MSQLFSPLKLKDVQFRNRIAVSPMCQYSSVQNGFANDWHLVHLGSRAVGGAGLIIQEATGVSAEGRISPWDLGIYLDAHIDKLKQITSFIHSQGSVAGVQIAHAGRKASHAQPWNGGKQLGNEEGGWQTFAPSNLAFIDTEQAPLEIDKKGIQNIVDDFANAATRALEAGYKVLELHGAHGYLIHEFLSPISNTRTDEYGGSFENRIRFLMEVVAAVQKKWPENLPLFVRISATDWATENGWDIEQSIKLSSILKSNGVDLIDCSSGGTLARVKIPLGPGYQVPFAERIKKEAGIMTGAVGLITNANQAEEIIKKGQADLVLLAREMLRDPYFPLHAAQSLGIESKWPLQYERAKPTVTR